jgi:acylphosphatase
MEVCKRVIYQGHVQGVGFRQSCWRLAQRHEIHGFVRNQTDGTVELVVEGKAEAVAAYLEAVAGRMSGYIHQQTVTTEPVQTLQGFNIRY